MSVKDYAPLYKKYSQKYGVPETMIAAVVTQESGGNPSAVSSAGAQGLMQVIPDTWREIEGTLGPGSPTNPDDNINFGTYYLKKQYDTYGSWEGALAAYNGGGGTWESSGYNLANMPSETRNYVPSVLNYEKQYAAGKEYDSATPVATYSGSSSSSSSSVSGNDPEGILNFAQFAESLAFATKMREGFEQGMEYTLHSYLASFMHKFYHNMYYVPTLPNNKTILIKPETMFVDPPSCNVIYPTMKYSLGFVRNPKQEPTRILMISDPVTNVFGASGGPLSQLVTMAFMDLDDSGKEKVVGISAMENKKKPMQNLTKFEKKNGVRILRSNQGEDLYLFLVSNTKTQSSTVKGESVKGKVLKASDAEGIGRTLMKLATYTLLRSRYENRTGNVQCYFNPYAVPGLPFLSVEGEDDSSLNVFGYVTDVTHQITEDSWYTTLGFTSTHIQSEPRPPAFPIIESEYVGDIEKTYKSMLGDAVSRVDSSSGPKECRDAYKNSDGTVSSMLKRVWRPLTTMDEHLKEVCDGATVIEGKGYKWLKNADGSSFFNTSIQEKLKSYTQNIIDGNAFSETDVR